MTKQDFIDGVIKEMDGKGWGDPVFRDSGNVDAALVGYCRLISDTEQECINVVASGRELRMNTDPAALARARVAVALKAAEEAAAA